MTRHPEFVRRTLRFLAAALLIPVLGMAGVSCAGDGASDTKSNVVEIIIPAGTQAKLSRGELVDVMPANLSFKVGDTLRIRNDDSAEQFAGPYLVQAGEQFELKFGAPGRYAGLCSLSGGARYTLVITE